MPRHIPLTAAELANLLPRLQATVEIAERYLAVQQPLEQLLNGSGKSVSVLVAKPGREPRGRGKRMTPAESARLRERVLALVAAAKGGTRIRDLVKATGAPAASISYTLDRLRGAKKVKMTGKRSLARWHRAG
jgi:hypothetical protein